MPFDARLYRPSLFCESNERVTKRFPRSWLRVEGSGRVHVPERNIPGERRPQTKRKGLFLSVGFLQPSVRDCAARDRAEV